MKVSTSYITTALEYCQPFYSAPDSVIPLLRIARTRAQGRINKQKTILINLGHLIRLVFYTAHSRTLDCDGLMVGFLPNF